MVHKTFFYKHSISNAIWFSLYLSLVEYARFVENWIANSEKYDVSTMRHQYSLCIGCFLFWCSSLFMQAETTCGQIIFCIRIWAHRWMWSLGKELIRTEIELHVPFLYHLMFSYVCCPTQRTIDNKDAFEWVGNFTRISLIRQNLNQTDFAMH